VTNIPKIMRAVVLLGHGGPEMLAYRNDLPVPHPGKGEVLVRVAAAGVNNTDINTRIGWYSKRDGTGEDGSWTGEEIRFPRIQGIDVCGTIVAVGESVDRKRIGERVLIEPCLREAGGLVLDEPWFLGSECDGGFAEFTTVAARHAYVVNSPLSSSELASFPCAYSTAENMLTRTKVGPSDTVLITGASGGVGSAAIQLACARGATVVAVTSPSKSGALKEIGADKIIFRDHDYVEYLGKNSMDVVVDLVGGPHWSRLLDVMRPGGRYAVSGAIGGPKVELDLRTLYLKDLSFFGCTILEPNVFGNLISHIEAGRIKSLVAETYGLSQIADAQASFERKLHTGKIVLEVTDR
jgi:NADPH:quinone reductase-like Zn-dependent oxidoreductase